MTVNDTMNVQRSTEVINQDGILEKDDFLKLLLTELQHQDPTDPMDSDKILSQTSQLATMESAQNTQDALEKLTESLGGNANFGAVNAIGRVADLGSEEIMLEEDSNSKFSIFFHDDVQTGNITIRDSDGNVVKNVGLEE
ncbi:MAG: flagellar hook capping FlgD N-terminal domain-containing protein, partial [Campylobacterota bacterium]